MVGRYDQASGRPTIDNISWSYQQLVISSNDNIPTILLSNGKQHFYNFYSYLVWIYYICHQFSQHWPFNHYHLHILIYEILWAKFYAPISSIICQLIISRGHWLTMFISYYSPLPTIIYHSIEYQPLSSIFLAILTPSFESLERIINNYSLLSSFFHGWKLFKNCHSTINESPFNGYQQWLASFSC